jgi:hypothetical protein
VITRPGTFFVHAGAAAGLTLAVCAAVMLGFLYLSNELYSFRGVTQTADDVLWGPGFSQFDVDYKLERARMKKPQVLAVGSSRANQFRDTMFPGTNFFNASGVARFEIIHHFLSGLYKTHKPAAVLITVDSWWLRPPNDEDRLTPQDFSWSQTMEVAAKRMTDPAFVGSVLFQRPVSMSDPFGKRKAVGYRAAWHGDGYRPDGSVQYGRILRNADPYYDLYKYGYRNGFQYYIRAVREVRGRFGYVGPLFSERISKLDAILELNREAGVQTILVLPPFASALYKAIEETPAQREFFGRFVASIEHAAQRASAEFFNFHDLAALGVDDSQTIDGVHADEVAYLTMVKAIADRDAKLKRLVDVAEIAKRQGFYADPANRPHYNLIAR